MRDFNLARDMRLKCQYRAPVQMWYAWCLPDPKKVYECCFVAGHRGSHGVAQGPLENGVEQHVR